MSERVSLMLKLLFATFLTTASAVGVAAISTPSVVTADDDDCDEKGGDGCETELELPKELKKLNKAMKQYLKSVKNMQKEFIAARAFTLDDAHSVGAFDLITSFLNSTGRAQLTPSGSGRRNYPRFAGFDDPDTRIGVDNPDTQYMSAIVSNPDCEGVWRIWGDRSNTADFILTTFDTSTGEGGGPTLEDEAMDIHPDGSFEVYASCPELYDPAWGNNWLELFATDQLQIARRQSACDWSNEAPGEIHIERVGSRGVPSAPYDPEVLTQQILDGKAIIDVQAPFWPAFIDSIQQNIPVNTATPWRPTGGLGITTQLTMLMWFELEEEEALILRLPDEDVAGYYGLQTGSFWGSSQDWANRHVSMSWGLDGSCQAEKSQPTFHPAQEKIIEEGGPFCGEQDAYFVVVSPQDPGVRNWIDTAELSQGLLAARLQSVPGEDFPNVVGFSCMLPVAIPVPGPGAFPFPTTLQQRVQITLGQVGASFTTYDEVDRADQLVERQDYARSKYIFW